MFRNMACAGSLLGALTLFSSAQTASAQWMPAGNPCPCPQPVVQPCYRTVPVTEYRQIRQTVTRPVYETKYVDQKVTAYRPITETRTANVPTVTYQNVTECQTRTRDMGYWRTRYEQRRLMSPCQYDPRPNLFGWLNRTGYAIRSTFTPRVVAHREYVPNVVAYNVPITRTVAQHGTRQVTYKVTRMEPYTTTRRVAVNTVRYVSQNVVRRQPVTVWRTVPIGSTVAFASVGNHTALAPNPDPIGSAKADPKKRTANSADNKFDDRSNDSSKDVFRRDSSSLDSKTNGNLGVDRSAQPPVFNHTANRLASHRPAATSRRLPSIVRAGGWIARRPRRESTTRGPSLIGPNTIARVSNR